VLSSSFSKTKAVAALPWHIGYGIVILLQWWMRVVDDFLERDFLEK